MAGAGFVSRLLPGHDSSGRRRLAEPGAGGWGFGGRAGGHDRDRHYSDWHPDFNDVARTVSGCDLSGPGLGWGLPGADPSEVPGSNEGRLAAGTLRRAIDPDDRQVHPVSWRVGPLWCDLPGFGSVCRAALPGFTTGNNGLKKQAPTDSGTGK